MAAAPKPPKRQPTGRRQGCELYLMDELARGLAGEPLVGKSKTNPEYWKKGMNDPASCIGAPGSNNWARISAGARLAWELTAWGIDPVADCMEIYEVSKEKWGGKEIDSTTYEAFTASADFAIQYLAQKRGLNELYMAFLDHNRYRAARYLALLDQAVGATASVGQRSAGWPFEPHPPNGGFIHKDAWFIDAVVQMGMKQAKPRPQWKDAGFSSSKDKVLWYAQAAVYEAFQPFLDGADPYVWLREHKRRSIVPVFILESTTGRAVWQPKMIHKATAAVLAYVRRVKEVRFAPHNRGAGPDGEHDPNRRSRHSGMSVCPKVGNLLQYRHAENYADLDLPLPDPPWTRWVAIGGAEGYTDMNSRADFQSTTERELRVLSGAAKEEDDRSPWERFKDWILRRDPS